MRRGSISYPILSAALALALVAFTARDLGAVSPFALSPTSAPHVRASLILPVDSVQAGTTFDVGLEFDHDPGWHTYTDHPGDAGLPTRVEWTLPEGWKVSDMAFPIPERFIETSFVTFGYTGTVVFPFKVTVPKDAKLGGAAEIRLAVQMLVCQVECVPETASLSAELKVVPPGGDVNRGVDTSKEKTLASAWARLPTRISVGATDSGTDKPTGSPEFSLSRKTDGRLWLHGEGLPSGSYFFYPTSDDMVDLESDSPVASANGALDLYIPFRAVTPGGTGSGAAGRVAATARFDGLVVSKDTGWVVTVPAFAVPVPISVGTPEGGFLLAFLFAILGGLILNIMPCVLPVLSLKVYSMFRHGAGEGARLSSMFYAFGIVAVFWLLALVLLLLRAGGIALGWGFQFQQALVLAVLAMLFFVIALNFLGILELPGFFARRRRTLDVPGRSSEATRRPLLSSFFQGALVVIAATPCTVPFMGSSLGYALLSGPLASLAIFAGLGIGMAAPIALLGFFPSLQRRFPKPGKWMLRLRQFLAFPLLGTTIWLASLLAGFGSGLLVDLLSALAALGLGAWILTSWAGPDAPTRTRVPAILAAAILAAGSLVWIGVRSASAETAMTATESVTGTGDANDWARVLAQEPVADRIDRIDWGVWSQKAVADARAEGKTVFVDFSADWCLSCKVNEATVLSRADVARAFHDSGVVALKADWTRRNDEIEKALEGFGRSGIPLYVYYAPGREPVLLPEILDTHTVLATLTGT